MSVYNIVGPYPCDWSDFEQCQINQGAPIIMDANGNPVAVVQNQPVSITTSTDVQQTQPTQTPVITPVQPQASIAPLLIGIGLFLFITRRR